MAQENETNSHFKEELDQISSFLGQFSSIWSKEVLNFFPESMESYPHDWIEELSQLEDEHQWLIDSKRSFDALKNKEFVHFLLQASSPTLKEKFQLSPGEKHEKGFFDYVTEKKQHEITQILEVLKKELNSSCEEFIDVCAGAGHLSRSLAYHFNLKTTSIDLDETLQKKGIEVISNSKFFKDVPIVFKKEDITNQMFNIHLQKNACAIGLHTCGNLANDYIKSLIEKDVSLFLSIGCCYMRLSPKEWGQSKYLKERNLPFELTHHALTLASRGHRSFSYKSFLKKKKVKRYRYALHLYLRENTTIQNFQSLGDSTNKEYEQDFPEYALQKILKNKLAVKPSEKSLNDFYKDKRIQDLLKNLFCADIIRWQFGRKIEELITFDRAQSISERGYETSILEIFDESISPRNHLILAKKLS